jgi:acetyltransferase
VNAANELGYPLAMKILSEQISHKSDAGGVRLNLQDENQVGRAYDQMLDHIRLNFPQAQLDGVLLQPMISAGKELILGGRQDPQFGPVIVLGMGGIFVEILDRCRCAWHPLIEQYLGIYDRRAGSQIRSGMLLVKPLR